MLKRGAGVLLVVLVGYAWLPHLFSSISLTLLTHDADCTQYVSQCAAGMNDSTAGWQNQPALYRTFTALVAGLRGVTPAVEPLRSRHAELLAAQGNFEQAAMVLDPLPVPHYRYSDEVEIGVESSRLRINGTPENAILAAYQQGAQGNINGAIAAMRIAIATAPERLGEDEWQAYAGWLGSDASAPPLPDAPIVEYALADSATWRGMDIVGVGINTSTFADYDSGPITVWLDVMSATPPPDGVEVAPGVWRVPYRGVNLAPNPGFEWGMETVPNGTVPAGYFAFYTSNGTQDMSIRSANGNHALHLVGNGNLIQTISSYPMAVDPNALYLIGATVSTSGRVSLGRRCIGAEGTYRLNLWIHPLRETDVWMDWSQLSELQHVAHVSPADPSQPAVLCQLVVEAQGGESRIENVFLIKIE